MLSLLNRATLITRRGKEWWIIFVEWKNSLIYDYRVNCEAFKADWKKGMLDCIFGICTAVGLKYSLAVVGSLAQSGCREFRDPLLYVFVLN